MTRGSVTRADAARRRRWLPAVALLIGALIAGAPGTASAQFSSGSTGVHGVFPPVPAQGMPASYAWLVWNIRTGHVSYCSVYTPNTGLDACDPGSAVNVEAQIPGFQGGPLTTGVYQFQSFTFTTTPGQDHQLAVVGTSPNTPLTILSQTDITITGTPNGSYVYFNVRGWDGRNPSANSQSLAVPGGLGGPGGSNGGGSGSGGLIPSDGNPGFGPAGGAAGLVAATSAEFAGAPAQTTALNPSLSPLTGGSGGGGGAGVSSTPPSGCSANNYAGGSGGGGGGALLLAASNKVTIGQFSLIQAQGGTGGNSGNSCGIGAGGAGGNVRIVAQEIVGSGVIYVNGANRGNGTGPASPGGYVRFEASFNTYSGQIVGAVGGSFVIFPTAPLPANQPQLRISSIGGEAAPAAPSASLSSPDITFQTAVGTVPLVVSASNVPVGTTVTIRVTPAIGSPTTAVTGPLSGPVDNLTAQANVILPPGAGVVTATAAFAVLQALNGVRFDGELAQRMEVITQPDGTSKTFVIARSGARFEIGVRQ